MTIMKIGETDYKIKFGYNCFCDTDLMERVQDLAVILNGGETNTDDDVKAMGMIKDLFCCIRELLFVGFKKYNPVETLEEIGDLLDQYREEAEEGEDRGLMSIFNTLSNELVETGFLADVLVTPTPENVAKIPADHKKKQK